MNSHEIQVQNFAGTHLPPTHIQPINTIVCSSLVKGGKGPEDYYIIIYNLPTVIYYHQ